MKRLRIPRLSLHFWWSDVTGNPWPECICNDWRYDVGHMDSCPAYRLPPDRPKPSGLLAALLWHFRRSRVGAYLMFGIELGIGRRVLSLSLGPSGGIDYGKEPTEEEWLDRLAVEEEWELVP